MAGGPVVVLAGGTGGAKLARGMLDVVGDDLVVVANTGDDVEVYDAHVSPDPDLVAYWLADRIDDRGWGLRDDTFEAMAQLRREGADVWFELGDQDLAHCRTRRRRLTQGVRLTETLVELTTLLGVRARVLPMSDDRVRTRVRHAGRWWDFQDYMIRAAAAGPVEGVAFEGIEAARPTPEALESIASARAIVVGPSNPVISIGPILALPGMREALDQSPAAVVAVSPLVGGRVLKGPTEPFMQWAGYEASSRGISDAYAGIIDGLVADQPTDRVALLQTDVLMSDQRSRRRVAAEALRFAEALAEARAGPPAQTT